MLLNLKHCFVICYPFVVSLCVFSPGVVAFGAFEESCFWFVCASCLLCPIIGNGIIALFTGDFDFWIGFYTFHDFNFFGNFSCFF